MPSSPFVPPPPFVTGAAGGGGGGGLPAPPSTLSTANLPAPATTVVVAVPNREPTVSIPSVSTSTIGGTYTATAITAGSTTQAVFSGTGSPASYSSPSAASAPEYGTYTPPPSVSAISVPTLSAVRPEASYLPSDVSAGLVALAAPTIDILTRTGLASIDDLTYTPPTIALFGEEAPTYAPYSPTSVDVTDIELDDISGLTAFIQDAEFGGVSGNVQTFVPLADEKTAYFAVEETRAKEKIFSDAAARGFGLPNGVVSGAVAALAETAARARNKADNEAFEAFIDGARKEFVDRVRSHVAALKLLHARTLTVVGQQIKLLRLNAQMGVEIYNAAVESYNKQTQIVREYVGAYRAYVAAVAAQDEAVVAKISLAKAQIQTAQADWSMYRDQLELVNTKTAVDRLSVEQAAFVLKEFEQKVRGYQQNAELAKINIDAFGQHVQSLNEQVQVQIAGFEMYRDEAEGAASQFAVAEANIGAYTNFLEADATRVQTFSRAVADSVSTLSALAGEYQEYGQAHRSYLQARAAELRATDAANRAVIDVTEQVLRADAAVESAKLQVSTAKDAQKLAKAEFDMRADAIAAQAFAEQVRINASLAAARATAASSVAQATASTTSISARISDDGNYNERHSDSGAFTISETGRRGWSKTTRNEEEAA